MKTRVLTATVALLAAFGIPTTANAAVVNDFRTMPKVSAQNWAGYAFQGQFTGGSGTFTVPTGYGSGYAAQWFGIDGYTNTDLIQAGVLEQCSGSCQYYAWWEILPSASVTIPWMKVNPGDIVNVAILETSPGEWNIQLTDMNSEQQFSQTFKYNGPAKSAEWIDEAPEVGGTIVPALQHTTVVWSYLKVAGTAAILNDVWCEQKNVPEVIPSSVANAGQLMAQGFTDEYVG